MVQVGDLAELQAALAAAAMGAVIELAGGSYGSLVISEKRFAETVTLRSRDPESPAEFKDIVITGSSRIALDGIRVSRPLAAGEPDHTTAIRIERSEHIRLANSDIAGSVDDDHTNDGLGLRALDVRHIVLEHNTFHDLKTGAQIGRARHVTVHANVFRDMRSDGLNLGNVQDATVSWNRMTDFYPAAHLGDHPDMIQVWNNGAVQDMARIAIRDNTLLTGNGDSVQAIFVQGVPKGEAGRFPFAAQDFVIEGNLVETDAAQGIWVSDVDGVAIRANTVIRAFGGGATPTIRLMRATRAEIRGNLAPRIDEVGMAPADAAGNTLFEAPQGRRVP